MSFMKTVTFPAEIRVYPPDQPALTKDLSRLLRSKTTRPAPKVDRDLRRQLFELLREFEHNQLRRDGPTRVGGPHR